MSIIKVLSTEQSAVVLNKDGKPYETLPIDFISYLRELGAQCYLISTTEHTRLEQYTIASSCDMFVDGYKKVKGIPIQ